MSTDPEGNAQSGRVAAIAIAMTGALWVGANYAGAKLGWSNRTLALVDLIALAGFAWALIATWRIWRERRNDEG